MILPNLRHNLKYIIEKKKMNVKCQWRQRNCRLLTLIDTDNSRDLGSLPTALGNTPRNLEYYFIRLQLMYFFKSFSFLL